MGWTCTDKPYNVKEYFDKTHTPAHANIGMRVLKSALKNFREYYAALEITNKLTNEVSVVCTVIICDFYNDEYGQPQLSYKEMSDSANPNIANCPESILKLLTPTDNQHAIEWRIRCWQSINARKILSKQLKHGAKVTFEPAVCFGGDQEFTEMYVWKGLRKTRFAPYPTANVSTTDRWSMPSYSIRKSTLQRQLVLV